MVEVIWSMNPMIGDSNVILQSHDGGLSWSPVTGSIPQWRYIPDTNTVEGYKKQGLIYSMAQQIDSLNAVVVDEYAGDVIFTHDGWKSWSIDSGRLSKIGGISFANGAEGMLRSIDDFYWTTVDSGYHWKLEKINPYYSNGVACQSDGDSMFRIYEVGSGANPDTIFTTHDNWTSWDTIYTGLNGPRADTSFHQEYFLFGTGDTIAIEGLRWDTQGGSHYSAAVALSSDLGAHWKELAVPRNNGITFNGWSFDCHHMIIAGRDPLGRILRSSDAGSSWKCDTVPLSNGISYSLINPFAITGSGRLLAGIIDDSNVLGSASLAYLEKVDASVGTTIGVTNFVVYPNPTSSILNIGDHIRPSITDALGRPHECAWDGKSLDVSHLPPGVYFVRNGHSCAKFIRE